MGALLARLGGVAGDARARRAVRRSATRSRSPRARRPGRCGCTCSARARRPRACARSCAPPGSLPALLPEWAYGHWKSRDVYEHQRDVEADFDGLCGTPHSARRDRHRLAVGDAVQHLGVQPPPVPGRARADRADARGRGADGGVGHAVGQPRLVRRADPARPGLHPPAPRAGAELRRGRRRPATSSAGPDGEPWVSQWWMGTGSPVDFTSPAAEAWWREQAKRVLALGVAGIKADDGEGFYYPDEVDVRRRPLRRARPAGRRGCSTGARCSARSTRSTPARACCSAARAGPASRRSASPGAATSRRTSGRCARWWRRR